MTSDQPWWLTWPPAEVAATILPFFSYPQLSPRTDEDLAIYNIVAWFKTGQWAERKFSRDIGDPFKDPDSRAIAEAIQVLEHTRLLMRRVSGVEVTICYVGLTRLGMHALQTNTVRQHLGLGDAPPTA